MGYKESTDTTSRKINLDFANNKIINQRKPWSSRELTDLSDT